MSTATDIELAVEIGQVWQVKVEDQRPEIQLQKYASRNFQDSSPLVLMFGFWKRHNTHSSSKTGQIITHNYVYFN